MSEPSSGLASPPTSSGPPVPAAPPSRQEIERRLSISLPKPQILPADSKPKMIRKLSMPASPQPSDPLPPTAPSSQAQAPLSPAMSPSVSSSTASNPITNPAMALPNLSIIKERKESVKTAEGGRAMSESEEEADDYEGDEEEEEEEDFDDEDGEIRRKVNEERVVRSGYLEKKGEKRKAWKKRWFVLRTGKLSFYKDHKEYKLLRIIDLRDIHSASLFHHKKYTSALGVVTAGRTFYLKAHDKKEAEAWVSDVNSARKELKERDEADEQYFSGPGSGQGSRRAMGSGASQGGSHAQQGSGSSTGGPPAPRYPVSPSLSASSVGGNSFFSNSVEGSTVLSPSSPFTLPSSSHPNSPPSPLRLNTNQPEWGTHGGMTVLSPSELVPGSPTKPGATSSSEDEGEDDVSLCTPAVPAGGEPRGRTDDPTKVILSAYLTKMGKRKNWRKRWFILTSESLMYSSSHMDTKPHRVIPMARILDALEYEPQPRDNSFSLPPGISNPLRAASAASSNAQSSLDVFSPSDASPINPTAAKKPLAASPTIASSAKKFEHTFKIVTTKRTFVICAPTEEEEVMWLSAIQALIARRNSAGASTTSTTSPSPAPAPSHKRTPSNSAPRPLGVSQMQQIPLITEQPPSPPAFNNPSAPPGAPLTVTAHSSRSASPSRPPSALGRHNLPGIEAQLEGSGVGLGKLALEDGSTIDRPQ